jgi:glycosyltransferase involved in cell wall biosynthesis
MNAVKRRPRLAVLSPFLDKRHGTERMVIEWIRHLTTDFEIHVYSQSVEDVDLSKITWHRISKSKGPHIVNYLWWFVANSVCRSWDRLRGLEFDLVFSPGVNCLDADAVTVHIVFAEFVWRVRPELKFRRNSLSFWPRLLHRKLYYRVLLFLERLVFTNPRIQLILTASQTAEGLKRFYGRDGAVPVVSAGLDHLAFNPERRFALRDSARAALGVAHDHFAILLVGNDWRNKGVPVLLEVLEQLRELSIRLFVVSREDPSDCWRVVKEKGLEDRVQFLPPRNDIEFYYAAADAYVGPSLQDLYAMPPAEAMACGLPVIVSAAAGVSQIITNGVDGQILDDPTDANALAALIRGLYQDPELCSRLGANAAIATGPYTWERSSRELAAIFEHILRRKARPEVQTAEEEQ